MHRALAAALLLLVPLFGCDRSRPNAPSVRVFAAASLTSLLDAVTPAFEAKTGIRVERSVGPTSGLAKQIQAGAPCDVFIAADEDWMNALAVTGAIDDASRRPLCGNRLVLIVPAADAEADPQARGGDGLPAILRNVRRFAVADPEHVPAGRYAQQALERGQAWSAIQQRVLRAADARAALKLVQSREADAGIVYASDAIDAPDVRVVHTFPESAHDPIRYPIAICRGARPAAVRFVEFLTDPAAAAILIRAGFTPASASQPAASRPAADSPSDWPAVWLSLLVAGGATLVSLGPGIAVAWLLARRRFPGRLLLDVLVHLPLVLPPVAVGFLLLAVFGVNGPVGAFLNETLGLRLAFTWYGAVLAAAVMGFPLLVRAARLAIELVDRRLEQSAAALGARPLKVFLTITLPLALPGVLTGMLLAFARSLGEFGATLYFCGNIAGQTRTLPIAIYAHGQAPGGELLAWRLVLVSLTLSLAALAFSDLLARRMSRRLGIR